MKAKEAVAYFQCRKPNEEVCLLIWSIEDVQDQANNLGIHCSRAEAENILYQMEKHHDASIGVTWETIDCYLEELKKDRAIEKAKKNGKEKVGFD